MSDTNNNASIDMGAKINVVNWAKGQKITVGDITKVTIDDTVNIRHHAGAVVFGVPIEKDTRELETMWYDIVDYGGIHTPLLISHRADDTMVVLQGNRRAGAAQMGLARAEGVSPELKHSLTKSTPMIILKGLTEDQERDLVQDQTQQKFLRSEIVTHTFNLRRMGRSYDQIVAANWQKFAEMFVNTKKQAEKRAEYANLPDADKKKAFIKAWFYPKVKEYLIEGYDLGPWMQECIMRSELLLDGQLSPTAPKPYFNTTTDSKNRIIALRNAKIKDGSTFNGVMPLDAPVGEFNTLLRKFHNEDYPPDGTVTAPTKKGVLGKEKIEEVAKTLQSQVAKAVVNRILMVVEPSELLTALDDYANMIETKKMLFAQYQPRLNKATTDVVKMCLVNADPTDFKDFLERNISTATVTVPNDQSSANEYNLVTGASDAV